MMTREIKELQNLNISGFSKYFSTDAMFTLSFLPKGMASVLK